MAPRIARSSIPTQKPRTARKKNQKRSLNAFAIAEKEAPERLKVRQHRLGEAEDDNPRRKRQRLADDIEEDEDDEPHASNGRRLQQKNVTKGRYDELDVSEGSDSDGNNWRMGHVDDDDDESLDSDEAFGESDEERFADFTFRGSSSNGKKPKSKPKPAKILDDDGDIDLDESEEEDEEDDNESLGSDAVDLVQMLDDYEEEQNKEKAKGKKPQKYAEDSEDDASDASDEDDEDNDEDFEMSDDEGDDRDPGKASQLQDFISSISQDTGAKGKKERKVDVHESSAPSEFGVGASQKLDIGDLLAGTNDPNAKKIMKMVKDDKKSKRNGIPGKLDAPLPKRQQDKLDRIAANEKTKETLERWVDTVKHNRRAEHLSFPMRDPDEQQPMGAKKLIPINRSAPANDLESTIQAIMEESGLATGANAKSEEEQIREFEELQTNKMPIEEVMARRAELRRARDLLFREEVRAKRVKKIKSKAYRRVHRKERERAEQQEREAMAAEGIDISEEERERNDRRRAEERMGAKHRESKWAKGLKASGRAAWDEDARGSLHEMARRNEELRQRIEGKDVRNEDDDATDISSEGESDDEDYDSEAGEARRLQRQLNRVDGEDVPADAGGLSKLASMKFMQRADAARKAQNDEDIKRMRRELAGENEDDEDADGPTTIGRRVFGPSSNKPAPQPTKTQPKSEFEERLGSDDEEAADEIKFVLDEDDRKAAPPSKQKTISKTDSRKRPLAAAAAAAREASSEPEDNPWVAAPIKSNTSKSKSRQATTFAPALDVSETKTSRDTKPAAAKATEAPAPADADGWTIVTYRNNAPSEADDDSDKEPENPLVLRKESLVEKAFAGDEVADTFEEEKRAIEEEEGDKVIDNTLPGWGSWAGEGVSKREQKRNKGRFVTTQKGVKKEDRKDAKKKNVIINEKRVKKNAKFLASSLPFPYENKAVYESTLRRPLGPEFNTKEVFQDGTKPRVMVKPGTIIKPLAKPMV
ncbi:uncharacterized protein K452DRAFT_312226 [Aplosporella prunicola CBS 121167]|uniref:Utp14-domain-containing protein n=1 Tax=Aplosporella prunicola CBS 121167 TaxID=1176127 RepID=A0A6A6B4E3_9PEZI|nr:uncharacterized protein K452DRAFT_312226 [Aplosporella prunicola CBS 121167]KAF2137621.1 hypothetical protein K452DRAFT_312226 [Aplosporella prunicola CBS 121167]